MFSLPEFTKVKVLDVTLLSQKNRPPGANPGVRLNVQADLPNYVLTHFDGSLRTAFFTKSAAAAASAKEKRQTLPGVEEVSDLPHLTSMARHIKKVSWSEKLTGYRGEIDHGMGGASNLPVVDASLDNWRFQAKEGGTVAAWWSIEMVDVPKVVLAELAMLKSREVPLKLLEPEVRQQQLEGSNDDEKSSSDTPADEQPGQAPSAPVSRRAPAAKTAEEIFADTSGD